MQASSRRAASSRSSIGRRMSAGCRPGRCSRPITSRTSSNSSRTSARRLLGNGRDYVCAFINIDMGSVGNWAERRGIAYSGYTDLAAKPDVYSLIRECVEQVNAELAAESGLVDSQIRRFLILHKELDPDDDELTRTRKVR